MKINPLCGRVSLEKEKGLVGRRGRKGRGGGGDRYPADLDTELPMQPCKSAIFDV